MPSRRALLLYTALVGSASLLLGGVILALSCHSLLKYVINSNLILSPNSSIFNIWKEPPAAASISFYFFNWSNPEDIYNKTVKPKFEQVGPYEFIETDKKTDIVWNENGTITFKRAKFWKYKDEEGNGNLQDKVTTINPVAATMAHISRTWSIFLRGGVSFTQYITITKTASQLLFEGYPDIAVTLTTLEYFSGQKQPHHDHFGYYYPRNGSSDLDGVFTMGTGRNSIFGRLYKWNYIPKTPYFEGNCGKIDDSVLDLFGPREGEEPLNIFSPDICRTLSLQYAGASKVGDVVGNKYTAGDYTFDNGTLYPENKCFCSGECIPSGVLNVTKCKSGSPIFTSLPHFYSADPYYTNLVEGMKPEGDKHDVFFVVEPNTGMLLEACVRSQLNILLMFEKGARIFFPVLWFQKKFKATDTGDLNLLLKIPTICVIVGIFMTILGLALLIFTIFKWRSVGVNKKTRCLCPAEIEPLNDNLPFVKIVNKS